jgi:hypothetical protein
MDGDGSHQLRPIRRRLTHLPNRPLAGSQIVTDVDDNLNANNFRPPQGILPIASELFVIEVSMRVYPRHRMALSPTDILPSGAIWLIHLATLSDGFTE